MKNRLHFGACFLNLKKDVSTFGFALIILITIINIVKYFFGGNENEIIKRI